MRLLLFMMNTYVTQQRERVENRIRELIEDTSSPALDDVPSSELMRGVISQALLSSQGGKRLRALLSLAAGSLETSTQSGVALSSDSLLDLACAIEIFQTGALVHDDIIDDSDIRRGIAAAHRGLAGIFTRFARSISNNGQEAAAADASSVGSGLGIMLGDLLATQSLTVASHAATQHPLHEPITTVFLRMQHEVEIGQIMDLADTAVRLDDPETMIENCLAVFRWKTASYTTIAPLELGFLSSGVSSGAAHLWAERIGVPLGTAFQLADDLIDVSQDKKTSGKPRGGDIKEGKHTVLLADALLAATPLDKATLIETYSLPQRSDSLISEVIKIFVRSGAVASSQKRISTLWSHTLVQLAACAKELHLTEESARKLEAVCALFLPHA